MSNNVSDAQAKKWLKSIENAGTSANALGWVFLAAFPLLALGLGITGNVVTLVVWALLYAPLMAFYIYSGKQIKYLCSHRVSGYLLINAISSLFLIRGIIPLILSIQSFVGYYSFKKLDKTDIVINLDEDDIRNSTLKPIEIVLYIVIYVTGLLILSLESPVKPN